MELVTSESCVNCGEYVGDGGALGTTLCDTCIPQVGQKMCAIIGVKPPVVRGALLRTDIEGHAQTTYYWITDPRPSRWDEEWIEVVW